KFTRAMCFCAVRKSSSLSIQTLKKHPGTNVPGFFFASTRLVLGPISVGSVVIVPWTPRIVGTTTIIVAAATITVVISTVIWSRSIRLAEISRTIVERPGSDSCSESKTADNGAGDPPATATPARFGLVGYGNHRDSYRRG